MATRGRRNPALLEQVRKDIDVVVTYVCGPKPLKLGEYTLTEGVEVPGAQSWPRVEAWEGARAIRKLSPGEPFTPFDEFKAPIDLEARISELEVLVRSLPELEQAVETAEAGALKAQEAQDAFALEEALALQLEATNRLEAARQRQEQLEQDVVDAATAVGAFVGAE